MTSEISMAIDDMILDLREALEDFEENPSDDTFAAVQMVTADIENACEDVMINGEDDD